MVVSGFGFLPSSLLACRFGSVLVDASFVSSDEVRCVSPMGIEGGVRLEVRGPDGGFTSNGVVFTYTSVSVPTVRSVSPTWGVSSGGTLVSVTGAGFSWGESLCRFGGSMSSVGVVLTSSLMRCESPVSAVGSVLSVECSNDGSVYSRNGVVFTYVDPPVLTGVLPSSGPGAGGLSVRVSGSWLDGSGVAS